MKKIDFRDKKVIIISGLLALLTIALVVTLSIAHSRKTREIENEIFSVKEIILYSNATAVNNVTGSSLTNLSICQYSDISIYIDNQLDTLGLTKSNTIKKMYIDNISISTNGEVGTQLLNYKNPFNFGEYAEIEKPENGRIDFSAIYSNTQNTNDAYANPVFYTDCSNPISLGYLNKHIIPNYSISEKNTTVSYSGKLLKETGVNLNDINGTIHFTIHIVNNAGHKLSCDMEINILLDDDFVSNGYSYLNLALPKQDYHFTRE